MPSDSISEHLVIFQNFPERHAPRPPSINMLHMLIVLCTVTHTIILYKKDPVYIYTTYLL